jgi:hypothetical protein
MGKKLSSRSIIFLRALTDGDAALKEALLSGPWELVDLFRILLDSA